MKDKKPKQNAINNGTTYFYCEIVIMKRKATITFKPSSELYFQEVYHQTKLKFEKKLESMRGMAHLWTWIKEDKGKELPQEHKKLLKWHGKHWKEIKEELVQEHMD